MTKKQKLRGFHSVYGIEKIIRNYSNYPELLSLKAQIQHAIGIDEPLPNELNTKNQLRLSFDKRSFEIWKKYSNISAAIIGSPFCIYRRMHDIQQDPDAKGTVVFPAHSTNKVKAEFDVDKYCQKLLALPEKFHPITICMYYEDIVCWNRQEAFEKYGFKIVTAGDKHSHNFVKNYYEILRKHKYATSNNFGTCLIYAIEMGIPFFYYGLDDDVYFNNISSNNLCQKNEKTVKRLKELDIAQKTMELFPNEPTDIITEEQKEFVKKETGLDDNLKPLPLKFLLLKNYFKTEFKQYGFNVFYRLIHKYVTHFILRLKIKKLAKKLKNKKVCLYSASLLTKYLTEIYDFSDFNITGIIDKNPDLKHKKLLDYPIYTPDKLIDLKPDIILVTIFHQKEVVPFLEKYIADNNLQTEIIEGFFDLILPSIDF